LYLLGGGWDRLNVRAAFPVQQRCALAAAFRIAWTETNRPHAVELEVVDEDGRRLLELSAQIEVGRPPGLPAGLEQRAQLTADLALSIPGPGTYALVARMSGEELARTPFVVVAVPQDRSP